MVNYGVEKEKNIIEFEGEYINGQKNGSFNEYYYREKKNSGQYVNGLQVGIGKEYISKKLIFEGEYVNNEKNGI